MAIRIVIGEDDEHVGYLLKFKLENSGYQVEWLLNGLEALEAIRREPPDLVLLDVMMPGMNGFLVLDALRSDPATAGVPVMMLTALGQEHDVVKGFSQGADDYLVKPFRPTELIARIEKLLRKRP